MVGMRLMLRASAEAAYDREDNERWSPSAPTLLLRVLALPVALFCSTMIALAASSTPFRYDSPCGKFYPFPSAKSRFRLPISGSRPNTVTQPTKFPAVSQKATTPLSGPRKG